jgi:hypothetical protein
MALSSSSGFEQWAYGIGRSRHGRHGKMDIRRGSSVRSDGIVLTMLLCSANGICAICSIPTKNITTRLVRTFRCRRTRRSRVLRRLSVARWRCQFWADCTTNISERKFPTGTCLLKGSRHRCESSEQRPTYRLLSALDRRKNSSISTPNAVAMRPKTPIEGFRLPTSTPLR